ncbi:hypothetical protein PFICI_09113 [Pestalotiopsis fici W106-1]|uniref:Clr5 domain-containing protein n=1 Tax=Pestalotiopsis fici (strain W106-1 / CGMCC3.15140) TaxID=1229662 RepID=W3WZJ9_PESFW|nr:uncharacterized protein PFICI_09113 [Pestalotiopsis fici W106-1]ETS79260.1 hypothetical protein PFICI_09113 [Pestalotiopsis fici W106-1]
METFFTTAEHHQIDFIKTLLSRAPNLNSLQIIERTRSRFGVYPSKSVTKWLHARMSGLTTSRDDVAWGQGAQATKQMSTANHKLHTQNSNTGKGAESHIVQPPQVGSPSLREKVRGTPWDRKVYMDRVG